MNVRMNLRMNVRMNVKMNKIIYWYIIYCKLKADGDSRSGFIYFPSNC